MQSVLLVVINVVCCCCHAAAAFVVAFQLDNSQKYYRTIAIWCDTFNKQWNNFLHFKMEIKIIKHLHGL